MLKKIFFFLFFVPFLSACGVATLSPTPTATFFPTPTFTAAPIFTSTPDIWEIRKCRKAPSSVIDESFLILNYTGDIERRGKMDMLLNFTENNEILGFAFDFKKVREYKVNGCVEDRNFTMWLQQNGTVVAIVQGEFPKNDPRHGYPSSKELSFEVITGSLMEKDAVSSSLYLSFASVSSGTMDRRFVNMGVEDDTIILNAARQFLAAIANDDRDQAVKMLNFPIQVQVGDEQQSLKTSDMFLKSYPAIFGNGFKERLAITFPNYLIAYAGKNSDVISLSVYGGGEIGFDAEGRVTWIVNQQDEISTPTALPDESH